MVEFNFVLFQLIQLVILLGGISFCEGEFIMLIILVILGMDVEYFWNIFFGINIFSGSDNMLEVFNLDIGDDGMYCVYVVCGDCVSILLFLCDIIVNLILNIMLNSNSLVCVGD